MDEARTIRFYVAPVLFLMSLAWGAWFDPTKQPMIVSHLEIDKLPSLIGLAAGGGFVVFAFGYVIGTFTYALLRIWSCLRSRFIGGSRYHEAGLSPRELTEIWKTTAHRGTVDPQQELSAVVVFDFEVLKKSHEGVHLWLVRRWNAFSIGATSVVGLLLSFIIGNQALSISFGWRWYVPVGLFIVVCFFVARWAWYDGRRMLKFMTEISNVR